MTKVTVTLFVSIVGGPKVNPVQSAIGHIARTIADVETVDQIVSADGKEANFAVTNDINVALQMVKETEETVIIIAILGRTDLQTAKAFGARFPERIIVTDMIQDFIPTFLKVLCEAAQKVVP